MYVKLTIWDVVCFRLQLPLRPCFAMTLNKSQGQTLETCGLHLDSGAFSHGQFYVGCSRVGDPVNLHIFAKDGKLFLGIPF